MVFVISPNSRNSRQDPRQRAAQGVGALVEGAEMIELADPSTKLCAAPRRGRTGVVDADGDVGHGR